MSRNNKTNHNSKKGKPNNKRYGSKSRDERRDDDAKLSSVGRDNDPNWYFLDRQDADTESQLSFQNIAGFPVHFMGTYFQVPNVMVGYLNPSPGVQVVPGSPAQISAINLAAFRIYSQMSAYTGRTSNYGPQDIATLFLAFGEVISLIEWCRRAFGVSFQKNYRNRAYPRAILRAMEIDPDDFFDNYANYLAKLNSIINNVNQLPIPANIAYFDKCASLYEKIYLDTPSSMAQTLMWSPATTWVLDETSYAGGTKLQTFSWLVDYQTGAINHTAQQFSIYLVNLQYIVNKLLTSSTLNVIYSDIMNMANKVGVPFWQLDLVREDYIVVPEYNANFSLQFHNATATVAPTLRTDESALSLGETPYNDVYPDITNNAVIYNPCISKWANGGITRCPRGAVVDMLTDSPSVEDRIEVTRFISSAGSTTKTIGGTEGTIDWALPDHYVVLFGMIETNNALEAIYSILDKDATIFDRLMSLSQISYAPRLYFTDSSRVSLTGDDMGDLNYYTTVSHEFLRKLHDYVGLGLYCLR